MSINGRAVYSNKKSIDLDMDDSSSFDIHVPIPSPKKNNISEALLEIVLAEASSGQEYKYLEVIKILGADPFRYQKNWLTSLDIHLYDPNGNTAQIFKKAGIPFKKIQFLKIEKLNPQGVLIVGESTKLKRREGTLLLQVARSGMPVICLSLVSAEFPFRFETTTRNTPLLLHFDGSRASQLIKQNLNITIWEENGEDYVSSSLHLGGNKLGSIAHATKGSDGWAWLEIQFVNNGAKFLYIGDSIISSWERSPTPRYLIDSLLHYVSE